MAQSQQPSASPSMVAELVQYFIASKRRKQCTQRTIQTYEDRLSPFVAWIGDKPLTRHTLEAYLDHLQAQPSLSLTTIAGRFRVVATFCAWLVDDGYLNHNIAARLTPKSPYYLPPIYTHDQLYRLFNACGVRDRTILVLFMETGLRASELISLRRSDYLTNGWLQVMGKGQRQRQQELLPRARSFLDAYLASRHDASPYLFVGRSGPLTYSGLYQILERRAQQAGIRGQTRRLIHGFRATFACEYISNGGDIESLRRLLGHATRAMTEHYAQAALDRLVADRKRQINPLDAVFRAEHLEQSLADALPTNSLHNMRV